MRERYWYDVLESYYVPASSFYKYNQELVRTPAHFAKRITRREGNEKQFLQAALDWIAVYPETVPTFVDMQLLRFTDTWDVAEFVAYAEKRIDELR
jgi:hypothetical protein